MMKKLHRPRRRELAADAGGAATFGGAGGGFGGGAGGLITGAMTGRRVEAEYLAAAGGVFRRGRTARPETK